MENRLPEGMVDLGPSESLNPDSPKILDSNGQATQPQQSIPAVEPPVVWMKDEDLSVEGEEPFYYPKFDVPGIATEYGAARQHKMFFPGEREAFLNIYTAHISSYLFGIECVTLIENDEGFVGFAQNPEFAALPVCQDDGTQAED